MSKGVTINGMSQSAYFKHLRKKRGFTKATRRKVLVVRLNGMTQKNFFRHLKKKRI